MLICNRQNFISFVPICWDSFSHELFRCGSIQDSRRFCGSLTRQISACEGVPHMVPSREASCQRPHAVAFLTATKLRTVTLEERSQRWTGQLKLVRLHIRCALCEPGTTRRHLLEQHRYHGQDLKVKNRTGVDTMITKCRSARVQYVNFICVRDGMRASEGENSCLTVCHAICVP